MESAIEDSTIAIIDIRYTDDDLTNIMVYGTDRAETTTNPTTDIMPDVLGLFGGGGSSSFPNIKTPDTTPWALLIGWLSQTLDEIGLSPVPVDISNDEELKSKIKRYALAGASGKLYDSFEPDNKAKKITEINPDDVQVRLASMGNKGFQTNLSGQYFQSLIKGSNDKSAKKEMRDLKGGMLYIYSLDVVSIGSNKREALDDLIQIFKNNKPEWMTIDNDEHYIYVNTVYEELGYPSEIYVGPQSEYVYNLEEKIKGLINRAEFKNNAGKYDVEWVIGNTRFPENFRTKLKELYDELVRFYEKGRTDEWEYTTGDGVVYTHKHVVNPRSDAGRIAIRHAQQLELEPKLSNRSKTAAKTMKVEHNIRFGEQFKKEVQRIIDEGTKYGIPEDKILFAIMHNIRRYENVSIYSLEDFENLSYAARKDIVSRLKEMNYLNIHGAWNESINRDEMYAIDLFEYKQQINAIKKFLCENPAVYSKVLEFNGMSKIEIKKILNDQSIDCVFSTNESTIRTARQVIDSFAIVDGAKRLFNLVAESIDHQSVIYLEKVLPSDILDENGYIAEATLVEFAEASGISLDDIFLRSSGTIKPKTLMRL